MKLKFFCLALLLFTFGSNLWSLELPEKHELDHREYRRFVLDNGLKVLLVSDPDMNTSAAAMDIGVGSLADPKDRPGLAHFLEHMLFLGTRKYPEEGEYGRFLKSRGGYFNAYTAGDHTNYHFDVHHEAFDGALDRFAQFFIAPLFNPEYTSREIQAVNNEHEKNLLNDDWRQYHLMNTFFDPEHPANHFSTGNAETLKDVEPATLKAFYERYYSANAMALTLLSLHNLDWMEAQVREKFASIENRQREKLQYPANYLPPSDAIRLIKVKPVKDLRELNLEFSLPSLDAYFESQPGTIIGAVLGHEGQGSLLSLLKKENLATGLSAGAYANTPNYGSFSIGVSLTPEGLTKIERIVELCFMAIARLNTEAYPKALFNELKTRQQLEKVYSPRGEGSGTAAQLSTNLNRYPMEWAENLPYSLTKIDTESYRMILSHLIPQNCLLMLSAKEVETDKKEPIYGTEYSFVTDKKWLEKLTNIQVHPDIVLPEPNPFMPNSALTIHEEPVLLVHEPGLDLYYSQDLEFRRPKASLIYRFLAPKDRMSLKEQTLRSLTLACIHEQLNEYSYPASLAGVEVSLNGDERGILLSLSGYSDSLERLCDISLNNMIQLSLSDERFEATKENILRSYKNFNLEPAYQHARLFARQIRQEIVFSPMEQATVLESINKKDIEQYMKNMWGAFFTQALVYGNINAEEALRFTRKILVQLNIRPLDQSQVFNNAYLQWPKANKIAYHQELETNNACFRYDIVLGPNDLATRMQADLLDNFISQPFYSEMRTRQQLGYIVWSGTYKDDFNVYLTFIIQSGTQSADQLKLKALAFLPNLIDQFKALPAPEFEALKKAVREKLLEKPKSIPEKASIFFNLAYNEEGQFNLNQKLIEHLDLISADTVLNVLSRCLDKNSEKSITLECYAKGSFPKDTPTDQTISKLKKSLFYQKP
jgi:insulysin